MTDHLTNHKDYFDVLTTVKTEIKNARLRAHLAVNKELILLYWRIGNIILDRQKQHGWGSKIVERLSLDLKHEFPEMKGFSTRNLKYMRKFSEEYPQFEFVQEVLAQLTWYHNLAILDKVADKQKRQFYIKNAIEYGWSRNILVMQIESKLYERQGKALTNFKRTLPTETSDLAQQIFKSEYNLEFLGLGQEAHERHIERSLVNHIRDFLLELGTGFSFMGTQHKIIVGEDEFYIDMLFFHVRLRCYIVLELKSGKFLPEYVGKLGFYQTAIDRQIKLPDDNPTTGLILCQGANKVVVEYALSGNQLPIGVFQYQTTKELPKELENALPTPEQFQHFFERIKDDDEQKE